MLRYQIRLIFLFVTCFIWLPNVFAETSTTKPKTIYLNKQFNLIRLDANLKTKELPNFYQIGTAGNSQSLQCRYENVGELKEAISEPNSLKNSPSLTIVRLFYDKVSPQIDYVLLCKGKFPMQPIQLQVTTNTTANWYQGLYSKHLKTYAPGRVMTYVSDNQLIIVLGHLPCLCANSTKAVCGKFMETIRSKERATSSLNQTLKKTLENSYVTKNTRNLIDRYFKVYAKNRKIDPCDRTLEEVELLKTIPSALKQDAKWWWWPFKG